jgi:nitrogen-specific signal transduction histidine kinase
MEKKTFYAPATRSSFEEILKEKDLVSTQKIFTELFGALTGISAIINKNRQIVFANSDFLEFLGVKSLEPILGKRPGEVVSCTNSFKESAGCGTSEACRYCGAVNAILESQKTNEKSTKEARISSEIEGKMLSWDLKITSSPIIFNGETFYVLSLQDISHEKKLLAIERVFFHDLLNTAGGLNGLLTILKMGADPDEVKELIVKSEAASQVILEEIMSYRQLRAAENGDIQVKIETVNTIEFINSAISRISFHEVGQNKEIIIGEETADIDFETDKLLFQRVLINLLKNALEATDDKGKVRISVKEYKDKLIFSVKNNGVIPDDIQMQIFQRSFSTKGRNRGIGTYSVRLVTENYLRGKVSFISNQEEGTIFNVELFKLWSLIK